MKPTVRAAINGVVYVTLYNIDEALAFYVTNSVIKVYQDVAEGGAFATTTGTAALVANTTGYTVRDVDATGTLYYKARIEADEGNGEYSDVRQYGTQEAYCLGLDVRRELSIGSGDDRTSAKWEDALWDMAVECSRLIDDHYLQEYNTFLASGSETRYLDVETPCTELWLPWPATSITSVGVDEDRDATYTTWTQATDYYRWPYQDTGAPTPNPILRLDVNTKSNGTKSYWYQGKRMLEIVGVWGYSTTVPDLVARVCKTQAAQWYKLAMAGWSNTGGSPEFGELSYPRKLDKSFIMELGNRFRRYSI